VASGDLIDWRVGLITRLDLVHGRVDLYPHAPGIVKRVLEALYVPWRVPRREHLEIEEPVRSCGPEPLREVPRACVRVTDGLERAEVDALKAAEVHEVQPVGRLEVLVRDREPVVRAAVRVSVNDERQRWIEAYLLRRSSSTRW